MFHQFDQAQSTEVELVDLVVYRSKYNQACWGLLSIGLSTFYYSIATIKLASALFGQLENIFLLILEDIKWLTRQQFSLLQRCPCMPRPEGAENLLIWFHMTYKRRIGKIQSKPGWSVHSKSRTKALKTKEVDLNAISCAFSQVCIPSLKAVFPSCLCRICCLYNPTSHDYDITTPIIDDLKHHLSHSD